MQALLAVGLLQLRPWKPRAVGFLGVVASAINCYMCGPSATCCSRPLMLHHCKIYVCRPLEACLFVSCDIRVCILCMGNVTFVWLTASRVSEAVAQQCARV